MGVDTSPSDYGIVPRKYGSFVGIGGGFVESVKSHSSGGIVLHVLLSKAIGAEIPYANILLRTAPRKSDVVQIGMTLNQFLKQL